MCVCQQHANVILLLDGLHRKIKEIPLYTRQGFLREVVCYPENKDCVMNECLACQGGILFDRNIADPAVSTMDEPLQWLQGSKEKYQTVAKKLVEGTVENALDDLKEQLPRFLWDNLLKEKQSAAYEDDKIRSGGQAKTNCMVQIDFAENYTCVYQDEVQSAHWRQTQITIFTVMIYLCGSHPLVIVTDCRDHDKRAVTAFLVRILKTVSEEFSHITDVDIWTDGPSSQFKNKFMFACLCKLQQKCNNIQPHMGKVRMMPLVAR